MPFDFELLFTGLCLFTFEGEPRHPDAVNVLLIKTPRNGQNGGNGGNGHLHAGNGHPADHKHIPMLTYALRDLTVRSGKVHTIAPGPDSEPIGRRNLEGETDLQLVAPGRGRLSPVWRPAALSKVTVPRTPADEAWLDWALRLKRLLPDVANPNGSSFAGLDGNVVSARIRLAQGTLMCTRVARGLNGRYLLWRFEDSAGAFDPCESQALAGSIVLRLEGLEAPVQIRGFDQPVEFAPPGPADGSRERKLVQVSITSFPEKEVRETDRLAHVTEQYLALVPNAVFPGSARFPTSTDQLDTPSSTLCPPGTH